MKTIHVTDEWLYRYMPVVDEAIIRELESEVDYDYEFSGKFHKKMKRLCHWEKYMGGLKNFKKAGKRVAAVVVIILAAMLIVTMSVEAYRVRFFESMRELMGDMFRYSYHSDEKAEFEKKTPSYIPDGNELISSDGNGIAQDFVYENSAGELLVLRQEYVTDEMEIYFDSEYDWEEQFTIAGSQLDIHRYKDGFASVYFEYGGSVYTITADQYLADDEFCRMIQEWIE